MDGEERRREKESQEKSMGGHDISSLGLWQSSVCLVLTYFSVRGHVYDESAKGVPSLRHVL